MAETERQEKPTLAARLGQLDAQVHKIDALVSLPEIAREPAKIAGLMRERGRLMRIVDPYRRWRAAREARRDAEEILRTETEDADMRAWPRPRPRSNATWRHRSSGRFRSGFWSARRGRTRRG